MNIHLHLGKETNTSEAAVARAAKIRSAKIDRKIRSDWKNEQKYIKLLLLGELLNSVSSDLLHCNMTINNLTLLAVNCVMR